MGWPKGKPYSAEHIAKFVATRVANNHTGERATGWKGDDIGYIGAHQRHRKTLPRECAHCGSIGGPGRRLEVALRRDAAHVIVRETGAFAGRPFSLDPNDYLRLCQPCHTTYDAAEGGPRLRCVLTGAKASERTRRGWETRRQHQAERKTA